MKRLMKYGSCVPLVAMLLLSLSPAHGADATFVQCPGDIDGDAEWESSGEVQPADTKCMHISGSDGFAGMADGYLQYIFGFGDLTGLAPDAAFEEGLLNAHISAPTIQLDEGDEFYLSLTNTGMVNRPDLSDPHTVHFHGFPNASSVFDGVPDVSISINMGATLTYYYNIVEPGTYLYHCHVEAAEHMQMGMQGNLWVHPRQNEIFGTVINPDTGSPYPAGGIEFEGNTFTRFAYNDIPAIGGKQAAGSTGYHREYPLQITGFDPDFHDASMNTQPLPFANMWDRYHMFNGRGYPDTLGDTPGYQSGGGVAVTHLANEFGKAGLNSQKIDSVIKALPGEQVLLRITNLSITKGHTVTVLGLPMRVIGRGGRELADKYHTSSVNVTGGEAYDVIVDTSGTAADDRYFVYITELNELSNNGQAFGGPMTEIQIVASID